MKIPGRTIAVVVSSLLAMPLASQAGRGSEAAELARYQRFASPAQDSAHILRVDNFIYLGTDAQGNKAVAVRTGFNQIYLFTVVPCPRLEQASTIGLTSAGGSVHAGADFIKYGDRLAGHTWECRIKTIQQVNYKAMVHAGKPAKPDAR
jgi:uncharacterized protein DUF6491